MCVFCHTSLLDLIHQARGLSRRDALKFAGVVAAAAAGSALASPARASSPVSGSGLAADTVLLGGTIVTVNPRQPRAEALAIRDGRILAAGGAPEMLALAGTGTELVDLAGRTVLPGFIDPHLHITNTALVSTWTQVSPFVVTSMDDVLVRLRQAAATAQPGDWVLGFGYDPSLTPPYEPLSFATLDPISTTIPIFVLNLSGHLAYANSAAFAAAGVTDQTPDTPGGGRYIKDAAGQLTGQMAEPPAYAPFFATMPAVPPAQFLAQSRAVLQQFQQAGCTTVNDNGVGLGGLGDFTILAALAADPTTPLRISGFATYQLMDQVDGYLQSPATAPAGFPTGFTTSTDVAGTRIASYAGGAFRLAGIKVWQDGSVQGFTAALREPYLNSTSRGFPNYTQSELTADIQAIHDAGWMASIHCNGDAAVEAALNAYETVLAGSPRRDHRHRIEHCTVAGPDQMERIARLGLIVSFLNDHVYYWGEAFRDRILGAPRAERLDPAADCVRLGIPFSFHCDSFTTPCEPLRYIQTAVTRVMRTGGEVLGPAQRITVDQAIEAVTLTAAYQLFLDRETGSLEPGKRADLVVLANDPHTVLPDEIASIEVLETWLNGVRQPVTSG